MSINILEQSFVFGYGDLTKIYIDDEIAKSKVLTDSELKTVLNCIEKQAEKFGLNEKDPFDFFDWKSDRFRLTMRRIRQELRQMA